MDTDYKKRRAARQKRIRQRRMLITFFVFLAVGFISVIIMCFTTFFPVKEVKIVSGSDIYSNEQIINASKLISSKKQLLSFSEKKLINTIQAQLPYVEEISIKRKFPDAVEIKVTDSKDFSYFKSADKYYTLSESNRVLKIGTAIPENTFEIITKSGIEGQLGKKITYKDGKEEKLINTIVTELKYKNVSINKIDIRSTVNITLRVENKYDVILGRNEYLDRKIAHLSTVIGELGERTGSINLSTWTPQNKVANFREE